MSFAQQLGQVTKSARDNFVQETLQHFMATCQKDAARGRLESALVLAKPEYFNEQKPALEQRLDEMGFERWSIHHIPGYPPTFEITAAWKVESQEPEDVMWQQGTHQFRQSPMRRHGVTRAPKALPW